MRNIGYRIRSAYALYALLVAVALSSSYTVTDSAEVSRITIKNRDFPQLHIGG